MANYSFDSMGKIVVAYFGPVQVCRLAPILAGSDSFSSLAAGSHLHPKYQDLRIPLFRVALTLGKDRIDLLIDWEMGKQKLKPLVTYRSLWMQPNKT